MSGENVHVGIVREQVLPVRSRQTWGISADLRGLRGESGSADFERQVVRGDKVRTQWKPRRPWYTKTH